jgi:hypothetical protein
VIAIKEGFEFVACLCRSHRRRPNRPPAFRTSPHSLIAGVTVVTSAEECVKSTFKVPTCPSHHPEFLFVAVDARLLVRAASARLTAQSNSTLWHCVNQETTKNTCDRKRPKTVKPLQTKGTVGRAGEI